MLKKSSSAAKAHSYALFDIGAASIGAGLAVSTPEGMKLLWSVRSTYSYHEVADYERYTRAMFATLLEVGMKLMSEGIQEVLHKDTVFSVKHLQPVCVVAPPWFMGSVHTVVKQGEKPFEITRDLINEMEDGMFSEFLSKSETESWQKIMGEPELLEQYIEKTFIEGYQVRQFEKRKALECTLQSYFSIIPVPIAKQLREVLGRVLPHHNLRLTSSTLLFSKAHVQQAPKDEEQALLIEIGGQMTSVALLRNHALTGVLTTALGTNHILHALAPKAASSTEANSLLNILVKKVVAKKEHDLSVLPGEVEKVLGEWHKQTIDAIRLLCNGITPPRSAQVLVDGRWRDLYEPVLERSWDMPGVRQAYGISIFKDNAGRSGTKKRPKKSDDVRLILFLRAFCKLIDA